MPPRPHRPLTLSPPPPALRAGINKAPGYVAAQVGLEDVPSQGLHRQGSFSKSKPSFSGRKQGNVSGIGSRIRNKLDALLGTRRAPTSTQWRYDKFGGQDTEGKV
jgi:hypothetical protein